MKIVVTGSLGTISQPLVKDLIHKGHSITVVTRSSERQKEIEALGAKAAVGSMEDLDFLVSAFKGADAVYTMGALDHSRFSDKDIDILVVFASIGNNYKQAIEKSGVKRVVHLSSIGAHTEKGNGSLEMHYIVENILNQLPKDVSITFIRPAGFYTNIFRNMQSIKMQGAIISNYGGDKKEPWVSPLDIASVISEELEKSSQGRTIRYVASDEVSPNEIAKVIGEAIGNPDLKWLVIPDEQLLNGMLSMGMNAGIAKGFIEMQASSGSGFLYEDYYRNKPALGKIKLTDFAKEFAEIYRK